MPSASASWDAYLWEPGGSVLRNLFGERDAAALAQREYAETAKQQVKIELGIVRIPLTFDAEHLSAMHRQLFGDVYAWAGQYRTVGISKDVTEFAAPPLIPRYLDDASRVIRDTSWPTLDQEESPRPPRPSTRSSIPVEVHYSSRNYWIQAHRNSRVHLAVVTTGSADGLPVTQFILFRFSDQRLGRFRPCRAPCRQPFSSTQVRSSADRAAPYPQLESSQSDGSAQLESVTRSDSDSASRNEAGYE
jgi:hypothetical protein